MADFIRTARERTFTKRDAMKHKGFSAVILVLGLITSAMFIFAAHVERLVSTRKTSGAAPPISIMAAASYGNRPIAPPPSVPRADRPTPLAILMRPPLAREGT